jgi:hypothetical protein
VGALFGGFLSYSELQSVIRQRADHQRFEQLAASDVVQQERKNCLSDNPPPGYARLDSQLQANSAGIKAISWTENCKCLMIETDASEWLSQDRAPGAWEFLLTALFPILGFFIPWGTVRAIGWVVAGFVAGPK